MKHTGGFEAWRVVFDRIGHVSVRIALLVPATYDFRRIRNAGDRIQDAVPFKEFKDIGRWMIRKQIKVARILEELGMRDIAPAKPVMHIHILERKIP